MRPSPRSRSLTTWPSTRTWPDRARMRASRALRAIWRMSRSTIWSGMDWACAWGPGPGRFTHFVPLRGIVHAAGRRAALEPERHASASASGGGAAFARRERLAGGFAARGADFGSGMGSVSASPFASIVSVAEASTARGGPARRPPRSQGPRHAPQG